MSEHDPNSATIERELAAIDEALVAGSASEHDPIARELQELALALRADSPEPSREFGEELHLRVRVGFPDRAGSLRDRAGSVRGSLRAALPALPSARRLLPAMGATAVLLLPIVVIVFAAGGPPSGSGGGAVRAPRAELVPNPREAASDGAAGREQGADDSIAGRALPVPPGGGFEPGRRERRIERSISLELEAPVDGMARVADGVTAVTNRHGGFVLSSSISTGEDGSGGDFELRIPAERLRAALRDLSELATVRSQSQSGRDVTRDFVTAQDRLQAARAERRSLLRRLEDADTDAEAEALRARLDLVAGEINGLRGQLRDLRLRTDYAVVMVSLVAAEGGADEDGGASGSLDDAIGDAGELLVGFAGVLVRVLALALPIGLIALVAWLASRPLRRRRRESALA
ncbi:MAG TPA: DUF4349 domain-containing protein [Thermoleophilaceae bacterium]|nr:DUF4349 domain-containing protein [Thermoleophilaceae bacterium]